MVALIIAMTVILFVIVFVHQPCVHVNEDSMRCELTSNLLLLPPSVQHAGKGFLSIWVAVLRTTVSSDG